MVFQTHTCLNRDPEKDKIRLACLMLGCGTVRSNLDVNLVDSEESYMEWILIVLNMGCASAVAFGSILLNDHVS
jgi:hypothetical protein